MGESHADLSNGATYLVRLGADPLRSWRQALASLRDAGRATPCVPGAVIRVGSTDDLPAYRIQWRPLPSMGWQYMRDVNGHDDALATAQEMRVAWGGQTRVIAQDVIETSEYHRRPETANGVAFDDEERPS